MLLLQEQEHTYTNYDILPVFIGESGVGAGILRHSCSTLPGETGKETGNRYSANLGWSHPPFVEQYRPHAYQAQLAVIQSPARGRFS